MKKTGKIFAALVLIYFSFHIFAAEVDFRISFDKIGVNESAEFDIRISGGKNIQILDVPDVKGLEIRNRGTQIAFESINGKTWRGKVLKFLIIGTQEGEYIIPPIKVKVDGKIYSSDTTKIYVNEKYASRRSGSLFDEFFGSDDAFSQRNITVEFKNELSKKTLYVGEPVILRSYVLTDSIRNINLNKYNDKTKLSNFFIKNIKEELMPENVKSGSASLEKHKISTVVYKPLTPGEYDVGGREIVYTSRFSNGYKSELLKGVRVNVLDFPENLEKGVRVGEFEVELNRNSITNLDNEVYFQIKIVGRGDFLSAPEPIFENSDDIDVIFDIEDFQYNLTDDSIEGYALYNVTVIPLKAATSSKIDNISFKYFNPISKKLETSDTGEIKFEFNLISDENDTKIEEKSEEVSGRFLIIAAASIFFIFMAVAVFIIFVVIEKRKYIDEAEDTEVKKFDSLKEKISETDNLPKLMDCKQILRSIRSDEKYENVIKKLERALKYITSGDLKNSDFDNISELIQKSKYGGEQLSKEVLMKMKNDILHYLDSIKK